MLKQREERVPTASSLVLKERLCLYGGIFIVSGIVLAFETILPRIFAVFAGSVFMYYAISIALMGLSGDEIDQTVVPALFDPDRRKSLVLLAGADILSMKKLPAVVNALREELPTRDLRRQPDQNCM